MTQLARSRRVALLVVALTLLAASLTVAVVRGAGGQAAAGSAGAAPSGPPSGLAGLATSTTTAARAHSATPAPARAVPSTGTPSSPAPAPAPGARASSTTLGPIGPVTLTGCPPSYVPPPGGPPSHPAVLVPESALPIPPQPAPPVTDLSALSGKGMWIWQQSQTNGGDVGAIVRQAVATGLRQVWVRMGSSFDGFYGAPFLDALVPAMHQAGIAVIGWGFPYLYDPVADVAWTNQALTWRAAAGDRLDGWSADIETASEGTALSAKRAATYLGLVRPLMGGRPLIATVYPPNDYWLANYPYQAMVPYIDAFAPMMYWNCAEPGAQALMALQRLAGLAPVHLIGQAFDMGPDGGRDGSPSPAEIARFLDVARRGGATGASFWSWQHMTAPEWAALSNYPWSPGAFFRGRAA